MKKVLCAMGLVAAGTLALPASADSWKCQSKAQKAGWHLQVSHTRQAGAGRVPGFFLLHNKKADGAIVRTEDRRRISLSGTGERGTQYEVKLSASEKNTLEDLADQRLSLKGAERVSLWVNFELNESGLKDGKTRRAGLLSVEDKDGEQLYSAKLDCKYDNVQD